MSLRHGFKASANRLSVRLRRGQAAAPDAPIDLTIIAKRLQLAIVPLSSFAAECPAATRRLLKLDSGAFSATTLQVESNRRIIIHNDDHEYGRQRSNLAHEIAHVLLGHPFTYPIDASGCRNVDHELEEEATWLGATILISNEAAMKIVRLGLDDETACARYGVSRPLLRMRINGSGARIRMARSRF